MATTTPVVPKNTGAMGNIALNQFFVWRRQVLWAYTGAFIGIAVILMILIKMMVGWNHAALIEMEPGLMLRSYIVAALGLLFWAFIRQFPDAIGAMVGLGTIRGLPNLSLGDLLSRGAEAIPDLQMKVVGAAILDTFQKFWKVLDHLMLFFLVLCVVFGTFPIENPAGVIGCLVALAGIGIWAMLFTKVVAWYRWITIAILLVAISIMLYGTYRHFRPQDATIEQIEATLERNEDARQKKIAELLLEGAKKGTTTAAEMELIKSMSAEKKDRRLGGVVNAYKDMTYEKKSSVSVDDFQDKKITGVRPGTRKFEIPGTQFLVPTPGGVARDLKGAVLMNGAPEGEDFVVGSDGVVTVSFTFAEDFKRENIPTEALAMPVIIK